MKHYFIDTLGDLDAGFAILDSPPDDVGLDYYKMSRGEPIGAAYPADAQITLSEKQPGIKLASLLGSTDSYLVLARPAKEAVELLCPDVEIEYLPFTLYNHKKRVHSKDYFIVNPIGTRDCLDLGLSEIEYLDLPGDFYHGSVVGIDRYVLDPRKLDGAPALFRLKEEPSKCIVDERLAAAFRERGCTNILLTEIEQKP